MIVEPDIENDFTKSRCAGARGPGPGVQTMGTLAAARAIALMTFNMKTRRCTSDGSLLREH